MHLGCGTRYQLQDREADDMLERRPSMTIDEQLHVLVHNFKEMVANEKLRREDLSCQHRSACMFCSTR